MPAPRALRPGWWLLAGLALLVWLVWQQPREGACGGLAPPDFGSPRASPVSLRGARVMLNPGHGLLRRDDGRWVFQRPQAGVHGAYLLEDDSNLLLARVVREALVAAGAEVRSTRDLDASGLGQSGELVWRESSSHYLERLGLPRGVWQSAGTSLHGSCRAGQDLRARAYAANLERADVLLSLHSNAGRPEARGTQVIYGNRPYLTDAAANLVGRNACLAQHLARAVPRDIQSARADLNWPGAVVTASDQYGENGYALMPAVILEVGFHTNRADAAALQQDSFRRAVAAGVVRALAEFFQAGCQ